MDLYGDLAGFEIMACCWWGGVGVVIFWGRGEAETVWFLGLVKRIPGEEVEFAFNCCSIAHCCVRLYTVSMTVGVQDGDGYGGKGGGVEEEL